MIYANVNGLRTVPAPGARGACPTCDGAVLSKCGEVNAWHWAHVARDCDPWKEPESGWHRGWKEMFPEQCREVSVGNHRADVLIGGTAIEFQHSNISVEDICARELHWRSLVWVLDGSQLSLEVTPKDGHVTFRWKHPRRSWFRSEKQLVFDAPPGGFATGTSRVYWTPFEDQGGMWARVQQQVGDIIIYLDEGGQTQTATLRDGALGNWFREPVFAGDGQSVLVVRKLYAEVPCRGWGVIKKRSAFVDGYVRRQAVA